MEFYLRLFFCVITLLGAFSVWYQSQVIQSAFSFLATMLGIVGLFVLEGADFVAATHLAIYVGGVVVLILFGIMFVHKISSQKIISDKQYQLSGISMATLLFFLFVMWFNRTKSPSLQSNTTPLDEHKSTLDEIARLFLTDYVLFFELGSILLTIALLGIAIIIGKEELEFDKHLP